MCVSRRLPGALDLHGIMPMSGEFETLDRRAHAGHAGALKTPTSSVAGNLGLMVERSWRALVGR